MMRVVMTGADCLLGWTTLVRMRALTDHAVMHVDVANWDSVGTIAEEPSLLGFPAVTLRDSIERPEALDTGSIIMTGLDPSNVVEAVKAQTPLDAHGRAPMPQRYSIPNTLLRAVNDFLLTWRHHATWAGLRDAGANR